MDQPYGHSNHLLLQLLLFGKLVSEYWSSVKQTSELSKNVTVSGLLLLWHVQGTCVDLSPGGHSTNLISLVGCNPIRLVKDEEELQVRIKSLTPSQMEAFQLMTNSSQQQLLFVTGPGCTGKSFLIHTVVGHLALCQGKFVDVLASSGSAAYLLGVKIFQTGCQP